MDFSYTHRLVKVCTVVCKFHSLYGEKIHPFCCTLYARFRVSLVRSRGGWNGESVLVVGIACFGIPPPSSSFGRRLQKRRRGVYALLFGFCHSTETSFSACLHVHLFSRKFASECHLRARLRRGERTYAIISHTPRSFELVASKRTKKLDARTLPNSFSK